jgi:hypothetical protein
VPPTPEEIDWPAIPEVTDEMLKGLDEEAKAEVRREIARARQELARAKEQYRDAMRDAQRNQREAQREAQREWEQEWRERQKEWKEHQKEWDKNSKEWKERAKEFEKNREKFKDMGFDMDFDWDDDDDHDGDHDDGDDWDSDFHGGAAKGPLNKTFPMKGPANLEIDAGQADVLVRTTPAGQVVVQAPACPQGGAEVDSGGSDIEVSLPWGCTGKLVVETPVGTRIEVQTGEGTVQLDGQYGDVEVETVGGSIRVGKARNVEVQTVQGNVNLTAVGGRASVTSVAGKVSVVTLDPAPRVEVETVSGGIEWRGGCMAGCRIEATTMSGDLVVGSKAGSSYSFGFATRAGSFQPPPFLKIDDQRNEGSKARVKGKVGAGEGTIRVMTHSGTTRLLQQ